MRDISNAKCHLENVSFRSQKGPEDDDGNRKPTPQAVLDVRVKVTSAKDQPWLESLFPGIDMMLQSIAGEEGHPGVNLKSKMQIPDQVVLLMRQGDDHAIAELNPAAVVNKVPFNVTGSGEGTVLFRFVGSLSAEEVAGLVPYTDGADLLLITTPTQIALPLDGPPEGPAHAEAAAAA